MHDIWEGNVTTRRTVWVENIRSLGFWDIREGVTLKEGNIAKVRMYVVRWDSKNGDHKGIVCLKRDWSTCSKYDNHSRLDSQHNWRGPTWQWNEHEDFHYNSEQDIQLISDDYEESGYGLDLDMLIHLILVASPTRSGLVVENWPFKTHHHP